MSRLQRIDRRPTDRRGQGGFTLLEVLVAFAVLAFAMTAIYGVFSTGLVAADRSADAVVATALAQSKLEGLGLAEPLAPGESAGTFANGFHWRRTVRAYRGDLAAGGYQVAVPYQVDITVSWRDVRKEHAVTLSSVRLRPGLDRRAP